MTKFLPTKDGIRLEQYISGKRDGEFVVYKEVLEVCGLDLQTEHGRKLFWGACKRLGREYKNKPNYGYQLSSPGIVFSIVDDRTTRIRGAAERAVVATDNLQARHGDKLTQPQKDVLQSVSLGSKAILGSVDSAKKIIRKELPQLSAVNPTV